jgi:hypothetical protein
MKAYRIDEWTESEGAQKALGEGIVLHAPAEKQCGVDLGGAFVAFLQKDDAIRLADEIYEKLGLGKGTNPRLKVYLTDLGIRTKERDEARAKLDNYVALYERANHKVHEKDVEITSLITKVQNEEKERAFLQMRIGELSDALRRIYGDAGKVL